MGQETFSIVSCSNRDTSPRNLCINDFECNLDETDPKIDFIQLIF